MADHSRDTTLVGHRAAQLSSGEEELYGADLQPGASLGSYIVEELRSRGGFATVYRARHVMLGRVAAVKVLHKYLVESVNMVRRFQQEAQLVNLIRHPNIVDIFEFGQLHDGRPFFVMEWLAGRDLDQELRARGPLGADEALAILEELCVALAAAHQVGVVHRDLKASNVVLVPLRDGHQVKLVDFGIAKLLDAQHEPGSTLSTTGVRLGTPWNMAPEQILGAPTDARTDVYALGVLLYQILTGKLPFHAPTPVEVEELHLHAAPPRPSELVPVAPALDAIILRCLAKAPGARYPGVLDVLGDLRSAVSPRAPAQASATRGIALHVQTRPASAGQGVDERALDDMEELTDAARRACTAAGLQIGIDVGNVLLGVALLPEDETAALALRRRVLEAALAIGSAATGSALLAATVHVAPAIARVQEGEVRLVGGDLFCVGEWTAAAGRSGITISAEALRGLDHLVQSEPIAGHPELRRVSRPAG